MLAAPVVVRVVAALNPRAASPDTYSPPMRRLVGFLATGLDALADPGDGLRHRAVQPSFSTGDESVIHKSLGVLATAGLVLPVGSPSAGANQPARGRPNGRPAAGSAGPVEAMAQRFGVRHHRGAAGHRSGVRQPSNQLALNLSDAWKQSRGQGQTVVVIDTGCSRDPGCPMSKVAVTSSNPPTG